MAKEDDDRAESEATKQNTANQADAAKWAKRLADAMEDLEDPIKRQARLYADTQKSFLSLDRAIKSGRQRWVDATDDLQRLAEQIEEVTDNEKKRDLEAQLQTARSKAATAQWTKLVVDGAGSFVKAITSAGVGVTKSLVSSYQSGAGAFATFGDAAKAGLDATNEGFQGASKAAIGVGSALLTIPGYTQVAGAAILGLGTIVGFLAEKFTGLAKFGIDVAVKELENTQKAFRDLTAVGALFANGLSDMRKDSAEFGLTQAQLAKIVSENNQALALYGGTVSAGVSRFLQVNKELKNYRDGLIKLGYSVEDIAAGAAEYMDLVALSGQAQQKTAADVAKETDAYLTNLRAISAFTGEDVKKAQARAREAANQSAVRAKIERLGGDASLKFTETLKLVPKSLQTAFQQLYATGTITDLETAAALASMPGAMEYLQRAVDNASNAQIDYTTSVANTEGEFKRLAPAMREQGIALGESIGTANLLTGAYGKAESIIQDLTQAGSKGINQVDKNTTDLAQNLKNTDDKMTEGYAKLIVKNQDLQLKIQSELDVIITQFERFGNIAADAITQIRDQLAGAGYNLPGAEKGTVENVRQTLGIPRIGGGTGTGEADKTATGNLLSKLKLFGSAGGPTYTPGDVDKYLKFNGGKSGDREHFEKLDEAFRNRFMSMVKAYGKTVTVTSGYRSATEQANLSKKDTKGNPVAAAGDSMHETGRAIDIDSPDLIKLKPMLEDYGFKTIKNDANHIELVKDNKTKAPEVASNTTASAGGSGKLQGLDYSALIDKMDELIKATKDHSFTSEKILHATQ